MYESPKLSVSSQKLSVSFQNFLHYLTRRIKIVSYNLDKTSLRAFLSKVPVFSHPHLINYSQNSTTTLGFPS